MMLIDRFIFSKHLDEGEQIYFVAHKHWIAVLKPLTTNVLFGFMLPWLIYALFPPFFWPAILISFGGGIRLIYDFIDWFCDAWLITSQSIIDLEWKGIFHHTSSRVEYASIEGVSHEILGFWGTILRFGTAQLDRMGNATPAALEFAANPKKIELKVLFYKELFEDNKGKQDTEGLKQILADMVARHIQDHGLSISSDTDTKLEPITEKTIPIKDLNVEEVIESDSNSKNIFTVKEI